MKQISTLLSIVALAACGVLFYLHFSQKEQPIKKQVVSEDKKSDTISHFSIAYFDIDTLQKNYTGFKDAEEKIKGKDLSNRNQLSNLNTSNQKRLRELQEKAPLMTQTEGEAAQRELAQLQQHFSQKELELDQELKKLQMELMTEIQEKVEAYLKKYNQQKGYSFIFSYRPGELIYYKDTMYDITHHLVKGLNLEYSQLKKKGKE